MGLVILVTLSLNTTVTALTKTTIVVQHVEAKTNLEVVKDLVDKYSDKYNVSAPVLMRTLKNENNTFEFCRQSELHYKANNRWGFPAGTREKSYGVAQIHLPDHPSITKEQACDPEFSIEFMAKQFALGRASMWMGYRG